MAPSKTILVLLLLTEKQKMGQSMSPEERLAVLSNFSDTLFNSQQWPGIEIDSSLLTYSGLNSTEVLADYRDRVLYSGEFPDVVNTATKLGSALGGFTAVPHSVGLGALIISMILETVGNSMGKPTMGTAGMLQRVFVQQQANEVRDLMDEYLKRLQINLRRPDLQLAETQPIEINLSAQLTRLKNAMLNDGYMSSRFLKQWANGAAFHTQTLIHQARLEGIAGSRAVKAAWVYQQQFNLLLEKYNSYLKTIFVVEHDWTTQCLGCLHCCLKYAEHPMFFPEVKCFTWPDTSKCFLESELVDTMFTRRQIAWAKTYFSQLAANIPTLVSQNGNFSFRF